MQFCSLEHLLLSRIIDSMVKIRRTIGSAFVVSTVAVLIWEIPLSQMLVKTIADNEDVSRRQQNNVYIEINRSTDNGNETKIFTILWYNPTLFMLLRNVSKTFTSCRYTNCRMTYDRKEATIASAVIFDAKLVLRHLPFKRPVDQIWIFNAHEAPYSYTKWGKPPVVDGLNWTMSYREDSNITISYGDIIGPVERENRNWTHVILRKTKGVAWVASHCKTPSKREDYVTELQKVYPVDKFGLCGTELSCGKIRKRTETHCFKFLNTTYKFYLAFENALCDDYVTEKFIENFDMDVVLVARGSPKVYKKFPPGTFINAHDFRSAEDLGLYLRHLDQNIGEYIKYLERKSHFRSVPYSTMYQKALCDICEKMNHGNQRHYSYQDISKWIFEPNHCHKSDYKLE